MMNSVQEEKGYCYNNEEDQDDDNQKEIIRQTSKLPFVSHHHHHQNSWQLGPFDSQQVCNKTQEEEAAAAAAANFENKVELMDLSLGNNNNGNSTTGESSSGIIEKEHMFDKVVTPSDVGKLNRLVIPKQHAERYFPLDSSTNEKGLLLNFEDRNGTAWRFRYSYWNSSQSYVMTKGWSRFVKDKKLDAGDIVSFQRGVGELGKDRLYIDWRRRPVIIPDPTSLAQMQLQNQLLFQQSVRWGTRLYSLPQSLSLPRNYSTIHPYYQHHYQQQQPVQYYLRPTGSLQIEGGQGHMPRVIDSVPVVPGKSTAAKRLRLFGVNMECPTQDDQSPATSAPILATRQAAAEYSNKGKSSLSFDLDL